ISFPFRVVCYESSGWLISLFLFRPINFLPLLLKRFASFQKRQCAST
uniref:Uncharacterized protein n=1 Tax=Parascaris univalens TaxID=6257 RepID=A0A915A6Q0_PARUN